MESGFQDAVGIALQLVGLVFGVGLLVVGRRVREPGRAPDAERPSDMVDLLLVAQPGVARSAYSTCSASRSWKRRRSTSASWTELTQSVGYGRHREPRRGGLTSAVVDL